MKSNTNKIINKKDSTKEKMTVDEKSIRKLAQLLDETGLTEIECQVGIHRIRVARGGVPMAAALSSSPPVPPVVSPSEVSSPVDIPVPQGETIVSPMVGTVYLAPEPGADPFVKAGDFVKKGDTLLIIEAMKVMNPIRVPRDGKILEICIADTKPVEFGEPLIILE